MKKLSLLLVAILFAVTGIFAQTPTMFKYQAVLRDASGNILANQSKIVDIDILQTSPSGTTVYAESHSVTTTAQGLINLNIGSIDGLSGIDWTADTYFIQITVDGTVMGTSQLLSVPYALQAKEVENVDYSQITGTPTIPSDISDLTDNTSLLFDGNYNSLTNLPTLFSGSYTDLTNKPANATTTTDGFMSSADKTKLDGLENANITAGTGISVTGTYPDITITNTATSGTHYLGEEYLGGIIFYLYTGSDGQQHGLVVSKTETTAQWQSTASLVNADRTEDGSYNTAVMTNSPAKTWVTALGAGWYLPSIDELSLLWHNRYHVNKTARAIGSSLLSSSVIYWSSTENTAANAYAFVFSAGYGGDDGKTTSYSVRGVQAF